MNAAQREDLWDHMSKVQEHLPHDKICKWTDHMGDKDNDTGQLLLKVKSATHASLHFGTTVLQIKKQGRRETDSSTSNCLAFVPYELQDEPAEVNVLEVKGIANLSGDWVTIREQILPGEDEQLPQGAGK